MAEASESHTQEELREYLHCWQLPGATLAPDQARALLAWSCTPDEERRALKASIAAAGQQAETTRLKPKQQLGHVSWFDRLKHLVGR
jgi:hypothetical protein